MTRVIVCGGRDYRNARRVFTEIRALEVGAIVVTGGARGADALAERAADRFGFGTETHYANWKRDGRAAGVLRNQRMIEGGADLVIAFPGGRGTADMVRRARKAGIPVREVR